jgi:hypothetical protein
MVFRALHSYRMERKDLTFFHVVPIFTELGEDWIHLTHKETTQSDIFLWDRWKFKLHFVLLVLRYNIPSPVVEILTLWSPHKLLKNLGALSEYAKCSQSLIKKIEIPFLCPGYNGVVKKTSQATFPLIASQVEGPVPTTANNVWWSHVFHAVDCR